MKKLIIPIFLIINLAISANASIFDAFKPNIEPDAFEIETSAVLLWMPPLNSSLEVILNELEINPNLKITIALSEPVEEPELKRLKNLSAGGQIELIMRLTNNPVIGLFYYPKNIASVEKNKNKSQYAGNNPFFFAQRLTDARQDFIENLEDFPYGFANSPGDIFPDYIPLAKSIELHWLASGPLKSTGPYETLNCEGVNIVPFELFDSSQTFIFKENALNFIVYDETFLTETGQNGNEAFLDFLMTHQQKKYLTVSEALEVAISTSVSRNSLLTANLPWTKNYSLWSSNRQQKGLLTGLEKTRDEKLRFIGLNQNKTKKIRSLLTAFYDIESGGQLIKLLEEPGKKSKKIELDLQNKFAKIYRIMRKNLPSWLFKSFKELSPENNNSAVQISSGTNFINFKNSIIPPISNNIENETESISSPTFRIAEMAIKWDDEEIELYIEPELINRNEENEYIGLENIEIDIYIDINNRLRAGRRRALKGNKINILPQDAWEYSISINSDKTRINYAAMAGIKKLYSTKTIAFNDGFKIILPRKILRGNPLRWGYSAILFSDKSAQEFTDKLSSDKHRGYLSSIRPRKSK